MGKNMIFLSEKEGPYYYNNTSPTRLELEECIHFHHGAFRFVWSTEEFEKIISLFEKAHIKINELGWPKQSEHMTLLSGENIEVSPLQKNRWAIEITSSNLVHLHLGNIRLRLRPLDFEWQANMFKEAIVEFYNYEYEMINICDERCVFPNHVKTYYLPLLNDYIDGKYPKVKAVDIGRLRAKVKWHIRYPDGDTLEHLVRDMDKEFIPNMGIVPEDLDKEYLFAIYESIKEWGYADGPFYGELLSVLKLENGNIQITDAHRSAALLALGYSDIKVFLSEPRGDNSFRWK